MPQCQLTARRGPQRDFRPCPNTAAMLVTVSGDDGEERMPVCVAHVGYYLETVSHTAWTERRPVRIVIEPV